MSEKFYTPEEVAKAILSKVLETYKSSSLAKANTSHEIHAGEEASAPDADCPEHLTGKNLKGAKKTKQHAGSEGESEEHESSESSEEEHEEHETPEEEHEEHESPEHESEESESEESEEDEGEEMDKSAEGVGKKISKLVHEGKPQKQAVATALSMERAGRLSSSGAYKHVKKSEEIPMKKGLDTLKEFLNKRQELAKADKGVHKELFSAKETNVPGNLLPQGKGTSHAGYHAKAGKKLQNPHQIAEAKKEHHKVLAEQKAMKKPNLPKSECATEPTLQKEKMGKGMNYIAKEEKGVHGNVMSSDAMRNKGESDAGRNARAHKVAKEKGMHNIARETKQTAKRFHENALSEQKAMKKPNLPKSELAKSKSDEGKSDAEKKQARKERGNSLGAKSPRTAPYGIGADEKGVHHAVNSEKGQSVAGHYTREYKKDKDYSGYFGHPKKEAKAAHSDVIKEQKAMKKPNLPKSEKMDGKE